MKYIQVTATSHEDALAKSGLYIGQPAKIIGLSATGTKDGEWTVHPGFEPVEAKKVKSCLREDV